MAAQKAARWVELSDHLMENSKAVKMVDWSGKTLVALLVVMKEKRWVELKDLRMVVWSVESKDSRLAAMMVAPMAGYLVSL